LAGGSQRSGRNRRALGLAVVPIALAVAAAPLSCAREGPPNLLLVSIDSLRADHLGAYGYERDTSPHIDRLAREGVLFEQMVAETSWTLPSHVTLLTGLPSSVHGVMDDTERIPQAVDPLASLLRTAGWRTEGYASAPFLHPIFGFGRGFDRYEVVADTVYDEPGVTLEVIAEDPGARLRRGLGDRPFQRHRHADDLAAIVEARVAELAGEPFFLFVHVFDVHYDYDPPEAYWRLFDPDYAGELDGRGFYFDRRIHAEMPEDELAHVLARYDGEIRWTDEHLGRMLAALERHGVAHDTLVVVTSDHGDEFFEHGHKGHKRTLYDEQLLVPFVLRLPGRLPAGRRVGMQVRLIDVLPTLLDALGVPIPEAVAGRSLLPFVRGERKETDLPAASRLATPDDVIETLRTGDGKLEVRWTDGGRGPGSRRVAGARWFDLERDPGEQHAQRRDPHEDPAVRRLRAVWQRDARRRRELGLAGRAAPIAIPEAMRAELEALGYRARRKGGADTPVERGGEAVDADPPRAVDAPATHGYPSGDLGRMLEETEAGYSTELPE